MSARADANKADDAPPPPGSAREGGVGASSGLRGRRALGEAAALLLLLLAAALPRMAQLERGVMSDELRWACRAIAFRDALAVGEPADTLQTGHPGVLTMWAGTLALGRRSLGTLPAACTASDGGRSLRSWVEADGQEGLRAMADVLARARRGIVALVLFGLALAYLLLRGAGVGALPSLGGLALLALAPLYVAHGRVLHTDAALATTCLLAVLAAVPRPGGPGTARAALCGGLAGLALLAKVSAAVLAPFLALCLVWEPLRRRDPRAAALALGAAALAGLAVCTLLWPALWVGPLDTLRVVVEKTLTEGAASHASGNFFRGRIGDPGPAFYPVALAFRLSPWGWLGLAAALVLALGRPRRLFAPLGAPGRSARRVVLTLLAWALIFGLFMTLSPKKFDRYALPSAAALQVAGGVALVLTAQALASAVAAARRARAAALAGLAGLGLVVLGQAAEVRRVHPWPMAYYNPLLGGAPAATEVLLVGWGEGYDLAAEWLNARPGVRREEAYVRGTSNLGPLFAGRLRFSPSYRPSSTDHVVIYLNQVQRERGGRVLEQHYEDPAVAPRFIGRIGGQPFVWIYPNRTIAPLLSAADELAAPGEVFLAPEDTALSRRLAEAPEQAGAADWRTLPARPGPGAAEAAEAARAALPEGWRRVWLLRYPGFDDPAWAEALATIGLPGEARTILWADVEGAEPEAQLVPYVRVEEEG